MTFQSFIEWLLYGTLSGAALYIAFLLRKLVDSVQDLNIKVAILITNDVNRERRIDKVESRLDRLEERLTEMA